MSQWEIDRERDWLKEQRERNMSKEQTTPNMSKEQTTPNKKILLGQYARKRTIDLTLICIIVAGLTLAVINYYGDQTSTNYAVAFNFVQFGVVWIILDLIWPSKKFVPLTDKEIEETKNVLINKDFEHIRFIPKPPEAPNN